MHGLSKRKVLDVHVRWLKSTVCMSLHVKTDKLHVRHVSSSWRQSCKYRLDSRRTSLHTLHAVSPQPSKSFSFLWRCPHCPDHHDFVPHVANRQTTAYPWRCSCSNSLSVSLSLSLFRSLLSLSFILSVISVFFSLQQSLFLSLCYLSFFLCYLSFFSLLSLFIPLCYLSFFSLSMEYLSFGLSL